MKLGLNSSRVLNFSRNTQGVCETHTKQALRQRQQLHVTHMDEVEAAIIAPDLACEDQEHSKEEEEEFAFGSRWFGHRATCHS